MAVTTLTAVQLAKNVMSADLPIAGGEAIVAANTMEVAFPQEGKLLLVLNNTFAGAKNITVEAGDFGIRSGIGDYVMALAQNDVRFLVVESAQFKNQEGKLVLSFEAGTTGFVQAFLLP
jgi:hypothetical protein